MLNVVAKPAAVVKAFAPDAGATLDHDSLTLSVIGGAALTLHMDYIPEAGSITMFSTTWCGYCSRLKAQLTRAGIGYTEINIEEVPGTAELVASINGGNRTVPTVLFPDGSSATNPSLAEVTARL